MSIHDNPTIYEINTWVWLNDLSSKYGWPILLNSVPATEWDNIAALHFNAVWLMGVWQRSAAGIGIANANPDLTHSFQLALPDFRTEDNVGSPYCIRRYEVDGRLGGRDGLAVARQELARRGMKLILDYVPNHIAPDHAWTSDHAEYMIQGTPDDLQRDPSAFLQLSNQIYARGRDPYFAPWPDVVQLNAFQSPLRHATIDTLLDIASQSDGVRCDMAMLVMNDIFQRTWGERAGSPPSSDFWSEIITSVRRNDPDFLFIAEAYWDLEWSLQHEGFDYCYDKRLYDRLAHENAQSVLAHLSASVDYQRKLLRFIENHDEPRAAAVFAGGRERAAAVVLATLPGARLFHQCQFDGVKVRIPVFLARRPHEPENQELHAFYEKLLAITAAPVFRLGDWELCRCSGWPDNPSHLNLLAWTWSKGEDRRLIVINYSDYSLQALVKLPWPRLGGKSWRLLDLMSGSVYHHSGDEILAAGLFVDLRPWKFHVIEFRNDDR